MPKILADENIHKLLVLDLRRIGLNVLWIGETADRKSISDLEVARLANEEKRILVTCDSDFIKNPYLSETVKTKIIYIKNGITKQNCEELALKIREILKTEGKTLIIDAESLLVFGEF